MTPPDLPDDPDLAAIKAALSADEADEAAYDLLSVLYDEREDEVIEAALSGSDKFSHSFETFSDLDYLR